MGYPVAVFVLVIFLSVVAALNSTAEESRQGKGLSHFDPDASHVCSSQGCFVGKKEYGDKRSYIAWYGIPYALPPLGELRFRVRV